MNELNKIRVLLEEWGLTPAQINEIEGLLYDYGIDQCWQGHADGREEH